MSEQIISIGEVMRIIKEQPDGTFYIDFVRATGKNKGSIKSIKASNTRKKQLTKGTSKRKYLHRDKWTVQLHDIEKDRPITPKYTHIIGFNGLKVIH